MARPLAICGATATGKTALSLMLAEELDGEIICCDSMQIYRGMDIGTAKPTEAERARAKHHLIDIKEPNEGYSAAQYKTDAESACAIHPNNVRRVARALEIFMLTGKKKSEWDAESRTGKRRDIAVLGLFFRDRERHREAIKKRCRQMMEDGLLDEARRLYEAGALSGGMPAASAIGYKELIPCLRGEESEEAAEARLFFATCQYAKRQATWFYKKDYISWLEVDDVWLGRESMGALCRRALDILTP